MLALVVCLQARVWRTGMSQGLEAPPPSLKLLSTTPPLREYVMLLWRRRDFAISIAQGELRARHMDTALGGLWHLLNPILLTAVYGLVFGLILGGIRPENFVAYLSIGVFTYSFAQRCITSGAGSIVSNLGLIRSLQFPRALLPLAAILRETMAFSWSAVVMVVVLIASGSLPSIRWIAFIPIFALVTLISLGSALIVARLAERTRDIQNVLPFLFRLGFYASGILFPVQAFVQDDRLLRLLAINPFYAAISLARHYLLAPEPEIAWSWLSILVWAPTVLLLGAVYFRAGEKGYGRG